jgi:hypothetical protein
MLRAIALSTRTSLASKPRSISFFRALFAGDKEKTISHDSVQKNDEAKRRKEGKPSHDEDHPLDNIPLAVALNPEVLTDDIALLPLAVSNPRSVAVGKLIGTLFSHQKQDTTAESDYDSGHDHDSGYDSP